MIVQTECRTYEGTEVHPDGSWTFNWVDFEGKNSSYTYPPNMVERHTRSGAWKIVQAVDVTDNYAAAFNMWMDQYVNDPQSFETSYDSAMRHVSEKLGGNEPSYGEVAAEQFKQYLNEVTKIGETK